MEIPGKRLLAGALAALIAGGGAAAVQPVPRARAASRTVTETYASPRHGNETGLGTVWLYEAEKIQSSQSLTSGQYIAMTKDANGNYVGEAGNKATIRVNESQNKAAYPMAATIEENAVLAFAAPRAGTISVAETAARLGIREITQRGPNLLFYTDAPEMERIIALTQAMKGRVMLSGGAKPYFTVRPQKGQPPLEVIREVISVMEQAAPPEG